MSHFVLNSTTVLEFAISDGRQIKTGIFLIANEFSIRPSIHGLVTDIQVNVYIGNTLSRLSFQNWRMLKLNNHISIISLHICDFSSKN